MKGHRRVRVSSISCIMTASGVIDDYQCARFIIGDKNLTNSTMNCLLGINRGNGAESVEHASQSL